MRDSDKFRELQQRMNRLEQQEIAGRRNRFYEYKSSASLGDWPLVHVVIGRDPATGKRKTARGIIAIGRIAVGVIAIGQLAIGFFSIGQLALGLFAALGQGAVSRVSMGQLCLGWSFSAGQVCLAKEVAVGQVAGAEYAMGQLAYGPNPVGMNRFSENGARFFGRYVPGVVDVIRDAASKPERE